MTRTILTRTHLLELQPEHSFQSIFSLFDVRAIFLVAPSPRLGALGLASTSIAGRSRIAVTDNRTP
ncbi:MAG: hypothetical protein KTR21_15530 [Rhodobacteraceae bacterium]|nr:hypothetical protein [Paracoccaceae bacterium]